MKRLQIFHVIMHEIAPLIRADRKSLAISQPHLPWIEHLHLPSVDQIGFMDSYKLAVDRKSVV